VVVLKLGVLLHLNVLANLVEFLLDFVLTNFPITLRDLIAHLELTLPSQLFLLLHLGHGVSGLEAVHFEISGLLLFEHLVWLEGA